MSIHILIVMLCTITVSVDALRRLNSGDPALRAIDQRSDDPDCIPPDCWSEANYLSETLVAAYDMNERFFYFADVNLRNQRIRLLLDTGSGSMWINDSESDHSIPCTDPFNRSARPAAPAANSSFIYYARDLRLEAFGRYSASYLDGNQVYGTKVSSFLLISDQVRDQPAEDRHGNDRVRTVGSAEQTFGLAYTSDQCMGILGIGYLAENEQDDMSLVKNLHSQGLIQSETYSLYPSPHTDGGSILFGAVDFKKYIGSLVEIPLDLEGSETAQPTVEISLIATHNEGMLENEAVDLDWNISAILDVGSVLTYLPEKDVKQLIMRFEDDAGHIRSRYGGDELHRVDCAWRNSTRSVDFSFGSATIRIPSWRLILPVSLSEYSTHCIFGVASTNHTNNTVILGFTFFTSAYAVFDLGKNEVFLAQSNENTMETDIRNITLEGVLASIEDAPEPDHGTLDEGDSTSGGTSTKSPAKIANTWSALVLCAVFDVAALLARV